MVKVYGASDDLIEIEGDIRAEFGASINEGETNLLAFSDGTLLRLTYDYDGIWRITIVELGTSTVVQTHGSVKDDTNDVVTIKGDVRWVVCADGEKMARRK